ncbi:MAG TPA: tRNA dihydrouridine synthase DusB, partial [Gammaproteobacteria bacterium]|nr:tRNA dihydrouridine synthase DusB [Gammaproteobacteria bacterium]
LCRQFGAALTPSEMVSANALLFGSVKTRRRLVDPSEPEPRVVQISGADPEQMARAAQQNVDLGAQIIDINMGCPAKKVCNKMAGSALLKDEPRVVKILGAVVAAVAVPVTLKIRTGWDLQHRNAVRIARIAEDAGIHCLVVHGRTRACGYRSPAEYQTIASVKNVLQIPVIANGDISNAGQALDVLRKTGADGVMIGRASLGKPWIFRSIVAGLGNDNSSSEPSLRQQQYIVLQHLQAMYAHYGEAHGVRVARKHLAAYCRGLPRAADFRRQVYTLIDANAQQAFVREYYERLQRLPGVLQAA